MACLTLTLRTQNIPKSCRLSYRNSCSDYSVVQKCGTHVDLHPLEWFLKAREAAEHSSWQTWIQNIHLLRNIVTYLVEKWALGTI